MLDVLLPPVENAALEKIGGPGKEFWVFGVNYPNEPQNKTTKRAKPDQDSMELGQWRLELSPKAAAAEDLFLTVMQVGDRSAGRRWPVKRIQAGDRVGCLIEGEAGLVVGALRDLRPSDSHVEFTLPGQAACRFLVTGLAQGNWQARRKGGAEKPNHCRLGRLRCGVVHGPSRHMDTRPMRPVHHALTCGNPARLIKERQSIATGEKVCRLSVRPWMVARTSRSSRRR